MIFGWKGRRVWVVLEFWGKHRPAQGEVKRNHRGIWEVRIHDGQGEFCCIVDREDCFRSRGAAQREACRRQRAEERA